MIPASVISFFNKYKGDILVALMAILLTSVVVNKCNSNRQDDADVVDAVSQHQIEYLQVENESLQKQITGYRALQDSLVKQIGDQNKVIIRKEQQRAEIALKYRTERQRLREMPDDSAAGLFLDRADCSECPIVKYDSSYLVDIDPIRFYNDLSLGYDEQLELNTSLRSEIDIQRLVIAGHVKLCNAKDNQIAALEKINDNHLAVETEKDKQIKAGEDKYKAEHRKLAVTRIAGGAVILFGAVLLIGGL